MAKKAKSLYVVWVDSASITGWQDPAKVDHEVMVCETLGFVVKETKDALTLCLNKTDEHRSLCNRGHFITIPKVSIKSRRMIHVKN
jgi:hypothetical protein